MDITLPLAEVDIEIADLLARRFNLLREEFGLWKIKNRIIYFEHPAFCLLCAACRCSLLGVCGRS
jgi:hypothetical protein